MKFGRRQFLGLAAGAAVGVAVSPAPWRAARDLARMSQDPPWLPGLPTGHLRELSTISLACPSGLGIRVVTAEGRPLVVRGDPDHPLSQGGITPPASAEARARFHPGRITAPMARNGQGAFEPVTWAKALDLLAEKVASAHGDVMGVGPAREGTLNDLAAAFLAGVGSGQFYRMPSEGETARAALALMGGAGQPGYDVDNAAGLVLIGADLFGTMPASPRFRKAWTERRESPSVFFGPERGATAALCGQWSPLAAGTEARAALGVAWHLADMGRIAGDAPDLMDFLNLARTRFAPEDVERETGLGPAALREAAVMIAGGALPVVGSSSGEGLGLAPFVAGIGLCVLAGRVNRPGGAWLSWPLPRADLAGGAGEKAPRQDLPDRLKEIALGLAPAPTVLLLVESDPAAGIASSELASRAVAKASFKAAFADRMTPSARLCDLILPASMPLERWDDAVTPYGLAFAAYGLARPLARPLGSARHPGDVLLALARRLGMDLGPSSFVHALRRRVDGLEAAGGYLVRPGAAMPWRVLAGEAQPAFEAGLWGELLQGRAWARPEPGQASLSFGARFLAEALGPEAIDLGRPLTLSPRPDRRSGLSVLPGPMAGGAGSPGPVPGHAAGKTVARVNAATAGECRAKAGDAVRISSPTGTLEALLAVDESIMDGHVALDLGLEEGQGFEVRALMAFAPEPESGASVWAGCRVGLEKA